MSGKQGGKLKPLKAPKKGDKDYDETDLANLQKKKDEEKALKELKAKASSKGAFGGAGLKKSGGRVEEVISTSMSSLLRSWACLPASRAWAHHGYSRM